jgi:Uma2 family endonuclease
MVMNQSVERQRPLMKVGTYRSWSALRPDNERWELIAGVPAMMTPPTMRHQRIASNLERLLNAGLDRIGAPLEAFQRVGVNLGVEYYDPEPDVVVVDRPSRSDQRYADRFHLAAEVVSSSDERLLDDKCQLCRNHPHCLCILLIRQDRTEVVCETRSPAGTWTRLTLTNPDDELIVETVGLRCLAKDLYSGTMS